jgi:hypothetical protein
MSLPRKSGQSTGKPTTPSKPTVEDKLPDLLMLIFDDFINAHALVTVAYRLIDEIDDEDRGAAVLVLGQGVQALDEFSDKLERVRKFHERGQWGASS